MENIFKDAMEFINSRVEKTIKIPIKLGEFEQLAIELIKKDTGVDLTGKLKCSYDEETYFIFTIIDDLNITDEELNQLGMYHPVEWFLNSENVLVSFFNIGWFNVSIYANESNIEYATNNEKDICCYIYMDYTDYEKIIKGVKAEEKVWKIPVQWSNFGVIDVKATSLKEALQKAYYNPDDFSFPVQYDYVDGTFTPCLEVEDNIFSKANIDYISLYNNKE